MKRSTSPPPATSTTPSPIPPSADPSFYGSEIWEDPPAREPSTWNGDFGDEVSLRSETSVSGTDVSDSDTSDGE